MEWKLPQTSAVLSSCSSLFPELCPENTSLLGVTGLPALPSQGRDSIRHGNFLQAVSWGNSPHLFISFIHSLHLFPISRDQCSSLSDGQCLRAIVSYYFGQFFISFKCEDNSGVYYSILIRSIGFIIFLPLPDNFRDLFF